MKNTVNILSERFEVAFNQIHFKLQAIVPANNNHFMHLLKLAKDRHAHVRYNYDKLEQYAKLRNSLVHHRYEPERYIAEPHLDVVEDIERISSLINKPPLALEIASKPVVSFKPESSLHEILHKFAETGFSQFPIYDENGFRGLLTEGGITKWFSRGFVANSAVTIESAVATDILELEKPHNVDFIKRTKTIFDLEDIFESYFDKNKKLEALLVTENGKPHEKPIGIITSWDLVQIDHTTISLTANT